jgi:spore germination protein GerM
VEAGVMRRRSRLIGCLAAVCLLATVLAACGTGAQSDPTKLNPHTVPFDLLSGPTTTTPTTVAPTRKYPFVVYYETPDGIVFVLRTSNVAPRPQTVIASLMQGPTKDEAEFGMRSAVPPRTVDHVSGLLRGMVTIDLNPSFAQVVLAEQKVALTQLVFTMTSLHGVKQVQFLMNGERVSVPRGNGTLTVQPVKRSDYAATGTQ